MFVDCFLKGSDGKCNFTVSDVAAHIRNYTCLPTNETEIAAYLAQHGPLSIALNAAWLQFYLGGISDPLLCSTKTLDHAVLLVGFGVEKDKEYWV